MDYDSDVLIVGGGLVGASLALALGRAGLERYRDRFTASRYAERFKALLAGQMQQLEQS